MNQRRTKQIELFPTTVMSVDMAGHPCKEKALEIIDSNKTDSHPLLKQGRSNFQSTGGFLFNPELEELRLDIQDAIDKFSAVLGTFPVRLSNNWFNIMEPGGVVHPHRHEGSVISGAYYIRAPEGSSNLYFSSPLKPLRMNEITKISNPLNAGESYVPCNEDMLVLFPSWLEHYTDENHNSERTVISFNSDYSKKSTVL